MAAKKIGHFAVDDAKRIAKHVRRFGDKQPAANRRHRRRVQASNVGAIVVAVFEQIGGVDGTDSTPATWRYNIRVFDDETVVLFADLDPVITPHRYRRPNIGSMAPATTGLITFDSTGKLIVIHAYEVMDNSIECE